MDKYIIVNAIDGDELVKQVCSLIEKGYEPQGGICVSCVGGSDTSSILRQAMVLSNVEVVYTDSHKYMPKIEGVVVDKLEQMSEEDFNKIPLQDPAQKEKVLISVLKKGSEYIDTANRLPEKYEDCSKPEFSEYFGGVLSGMILNNATWAIRKLYDLLIIYNDSWTPDYKDNTTKYVICFYEDVVLKGESNKEQHFLTFKTEVLRDLFYDRFYNIILEAKSLL